MTSEPVRHEGRRLIGAGTKPGRGVEERIKEHKGEDLAQPDSTFGTKPIVSTRPVSASLKDACLIQIYPTGITIGTRHVLRERDTVLGRDDECDITIHDQSISRRHSVLKWTEKGFVVTDLHSTNGTFVNDEPAEQTLLLDGDYLRVGICLFRFLSGGNVEAEYHEELYRMALFDGLTGIHNKRYLLDHLEREIARSARYGRPLSLVMLDVDHFKQINDTLGHLAGDLVLKGLAQRLRPKVRKYDLLARYGGEEFAVVLSETSKKDALEIAEKFRIAVEAVPFEFGGKSFRVTISAGVASVVNNGLLDPEQLIRVADARMYESKRAGRNRVKG